MTYVFMNALTELTICLPITISVVLTLKLLKRSIILYKNIATKGFFQFEIIINVLVSSFWFIWIPMLWLYGE